MDTHHHNPVTSPDDEEDIFRAAFDPATATGKVKIGGAPGPRSTSPAQCGMEKSDPLKDAGDEEAVGRMQNLADEHLAQCCGGPGQTGSMDGPVVRKANSVDTGCSSFVIDEYASSPEEVEDDEGGDKFIEISVSDPIRVGEGMSSYLAYDVSTRTNMKPFKRGEFSVKRRFSDFLGMYDKLYEKYSRRGRIIPPAPEKNLVGTTKVKMAPPADGQLSGERADFVARRRLALERFVNRLAQHPVLRRDSNFVEFIESNRELPRATSTSALSSASVLRLLGRMGDTVNKIGFKMDETDPWYEEKVRQMDSLDSQLKRLLGAVESLHACRQELCAATGMLAQAVAALSGVEEAHSLSRTLSHLSKVEEKVEAVHRSQAEADSLFLVELVKEYVWLVAAVKDALNERTKAFQAAHNAGQVLMRKKEQLARVEMAGRTDKLSAAREEVDEWENKVEQCQANFVKISRVIKVEVDLFERYRVRDFKQSMLQYLDAMVEGQLRILHHWQHFLPEVKNGLY